MAGKTTIKCGGDGQHTTVFSRSHEVTFSRNEWLPVGSTLLSCTTSIQIGFKCVYPPDAVGWVELDRVKNYRLRLVIPSHPNKDNQKPVETFMHPDVSLLISDSHSPITVPRGGSNCPVS